MRRKPLPNAEAIEARVRALCEAGMVTKEIRAAIKREFEESLSYAEIGEWTHDIIEARRESNGLTTMLMVLFPEGFDYLPIGRRPFATLARPFDQSEPWAVFRSPVMQGGALRGQRRYTFTTGSGARVVTWAKSLVAWLEAMKRTGYRIKAYDPAEQPEQTEMFTSAQKVAA